MPRKTPTHLYLPAAGVRDDFLSVMNEFLELKTVRFSEFSEIWRSKKMSYLCAGRHSDREAREFMERAFLIALDFFLPPYQFQVRVGGLYLLYSLYMTQPIIPGVKVRLTQGQWKETMRFQQEAAQQNHLDVVYVFNNMLQEHAFQFCFTASEMSSKAHHHETESGGIDLAEDMKEDRRDIDRLFNYEAMEQLSYLMDHYQQMKVNLAGPEATQPDKSLDVVQGKMVEDLVSMLQSFKTRAGNIQKHGKSEPETNKKQEEQEQSGETTGSRRQTLKARAFSEITKGGGRSTFVISVEGDEPASEESQEQVPPDHQTEDFKTISSNSVTNERKGSRQLEASRIPSLTSKQEEDTEKKWSRRMDHGLPGSNVASDPLLNADNVLCVEVYSKSTTEGPNVYGTEGQGHTSSTSLHPLIHEEKVSSPEPNISKKAHLKGAHFFATLESSNLHEGKEIMLCTEDSGKERNPVINKGRNGKSHNFQSDKVDARCFVPVAGGRGTKVSLPAFESVDYDPPAKKSHSKSKKLKKLNSDDSSPSGSKVRRSKKSTKKGNEKWPKMLDLAATESGGKGGQQQSEKVNSGTNNKERKGKKKDSALTARHLSTSQSKAKSQSPKISNKKKLSKKESSDSSDKGSSDGNSKTPYECNSSTSKIGKEAAVIRTKGQNITQTSEEQASHSLSNEINKVKRKRKVREKHTKTPVINKTSKSSLIEASVQEVGCQSMGEEFESSLKVTRVIEQEVATTDSVKEVNELRGRQISKHSKEKVTIIRPSTAKRKLSEPEMKSSQKASSKRKRSSRERDEHSLNVSVTEDGLSPPKKIAPPKFNRKHLEASSVMEHDANSKLSKVDKKALKKSTAKGNDTNTHIAKVKTSLKNSSVTGDERKSNQSKYQGKSGASSVGTVKEILVYREPNKATIFKESAEYTVPITSPRISTSPKKALKETITRQVEVRFI